MKLEDLHALYERNHLKEEEYDFAVSVLKTFNGYSSEHFQMDIDELNSHQLDQYIAHLKQDNTITIPLVVVLMRYYRIIKRHDLFIRLTQYTGGLDVIENILIRVKQYAGVDVLKQISEGLVIPSFGTSPEDMPQFTELFMKRLEQEIEPGLMKRILAGNNHGVPKSAMLDEKVLYEAALSLEVYLKERHERKVLELQQFCDEHRVWFEQSITQEVVDFVKSNQEILSAVLIDDKLYQTKIPYDTVAYLNSKSAEERRYYACHCPFAREAILNPKHAISKNWCYCSAGFEKYLFEVIFDRELPIECLSSALHTDDLCRFVIDLSDVDYKK